MDDLDSVQDLLPCGLISVDAAGRITRINRCGLDWLGYTTLLGQPFADLLTPAAAARLATLGDEALCQLTLELRGQDGR